MEIKHGVVHSYIVTEHSGEYWEVTVWCRANNILYCTMNDIFPRLIRMSRDDAVICYLTMVDN